VASLPRKPSSTIKNSPLEISYVIDNSDEMTGEDFSDQALLYVPTASEISSGEFLIVDDGFRGNDATTQREALEEYISNNEYLSSRRGDYVERNGDRTPFTNIVDLKVVQNFWLPVGDRKHNLQFSFDIFNFTNLLNPQWGQRYFVSFDAVEVTRFDGFVDPDGDGLNLQPAYTFNPGTADLSTNEGFNLDDAGIRSSRWQGQFGIRYTF
ncbi:MAG: hypothetical protein AAFQ98_22255, partial [Bacteroidota bacterium]